MVSPFLVADNKRRSIRKQSNSRYVDRNHKRIVLIRRSNNQKKLGNFSGKRSLTGKIPTIRSIFLEQKLQNVEKITNYIFNQTPHFSTLLMYYNENYSPRSSTNNSFPWTEFLHDLTLRFVWFSFEFDCQVIDSIEAFGFISYLSSNPWVCCKKNIFKCFVRPLAKCTKGLVRGRF